MELQVVTFEQAKALKELGFPQETNSWNYYDVEGNCIPYLQKGGHKEYCCDAPTLELAAKWLREKKGILTIPKVIIKVSINNCYQDYVRIKNKTGFFTSGKLYSKYEDALSRGIDNAINILMSA